MHVACKCPATSAGFATEQNACIMAGILLNLFTQQAHFLAAANWREQSRQHTASARRLLPCRFDRALNRTQQLRE